MAQTIRNRALDDLIESGLPWWKRYSSHGEFPWSTAVSLVFHLLVIVLIIVLARKLATKDPVPPAVSTILVGPEKEAAEGLGATDEAGDTAEPVADTMAESKPDEPDLPDPKPEAIDVTKPVLEKEKPVELPKKTLDLPENFDPQKRIEDIKNRLKNRLKDRVPGKVGGSGGTGKAGRGDRLVRWILVIEGGGVRDYLLQVEGLGGVIAFPAKGDKWLYVYNASDPARASKQEKDLSDENRIYWTNERRQTVIDVCNYVGIPRADLMVMFLPTEVEERMARLECEYQNKSEDEIAQTRFAVTRDGGKYGVRVIGQTLK